MLPKLLYIGDVPIENTYHGSALLYRLFEKYTAADLTIVETGLSSSLPRRLGGVQYLSAPLSRDRWLNTRFHSLTVAFFSAAASVRSGRIKNLLKNIDFDHVVTVAHGFGWLTAEEVAKSRSVPLHLIIHDDWPRVAQVPAAFRGWLDRRFGEVYATAQSRMCVSPAMRDAYMSRYRKPAEVMYPARAAECEQFNTPAARLNENHRQFTIAFAGTINSPGYIEALKRLVTAIEAVNGRLLIFGPLTASQAHTAGVNSKRVVLNGVLPWNELITRLREEVDALFVPMSFAPEDRANMELAFPSKLADYTAVGLPLLIYGPPYCSAVRWAQENSGVSEVVTAKDDDTLSPAVKRLASTPSVRWQLGSRALEAGRRYFSHSAMQDVFGRALGKASLESNSNVPSNLLHSESRQSVPPRGSGWVRSER